MTPARWQRVGELFHAALEVAPQQRRQWVGSVCSDDTEVHVEVLELLGSDAAAGEGFIEQQIEPAVISLLQTSAVSEISTRVGPYKLVRELGHGGMGTVYLAERDDDEYKTQVAIKLVRRGMDTDIILNRFYRERQTLARLQHPHIARLLDGGTTTGGSPYIVMEFVDGEKITDYCRNRDLTVTQRLSLFLNVCKAVDYAHRQFVVHRDLKPGNILVDKTGDVKLLDFGICKLLQTQPHLGEETAEAGPPPLTPDYASPEQIRGEPTTIASDVYSLAAVLYELLTGVKPHKIETYNLQGIEHGICEREIVRPSMAASGKTLRRQLQGDIDTILLFALQKDPRRRYASIEQFSEDVRRYLAHQPVKARPDTVTYRVGKFVRRRHGLVAAAVAILVTLSAAVFLSVRSARIANENLRLVRQLSNTFVFDVYDSVRDLPGSTQARQLIVQTGLQYLDSLGRNAAGDADLQRELAAAYRRIGDVQGNVMGSNLGNTAEALTSYEKALAILAPVLSRDPSHRASLTEQSILHQRIGAIRAYTKNSAQALSSYNQAASVAESLYQRFPQDLETGMRLAGVYIAAAETVRRTGDYRASRTSYEKALAVLKRFEESHPADRELQSTLASAYSGIAICDIRLGRLREALESHRQSVERVEKLVKLDPASAAHKRELMFAYSHLGDVLGNPNLRNLGDTAGAADAYRRMADIARQLHLADPRDQRARADYSIALSRIAAVTPPEAATVRINLLRQALELLQEVARVNPDNIASRADIAYTFNFLGDAYHAAGEMESAAQAYRNGIKQAEPLLASGNSTIVTATVFLYRKLGELTARLGDRDTALALGRKAIQLTDPAGPPAKNRPADLQRILTPRGEAASGLIYAALATSPGRRPADAAQARRWINQSLLHYRALSEHVSFSDTHRREMRTLEKALETVK